MRHVCSNRSVLQARTPTREDCKALGQAFAAARETLAKAAGTLTDLSCAQSLKVRKNDGTKTTRLPEFELVTLLRRAGYWLVDEQQLPHARVVSEHQHVFLFASASLVLGDAGSFPPEKTKNSGHDARPRSPDRELSQDDVAQALRACAALLLESCRRNEAPAGHLLLVCLPPMRHWCVSRCGWVGGKVVVWVVGCARVEQNVTLSLCPSPLSPPKTKINLNRAVTSPSEPLPFTQQYWREIGGELLSCKGRAHTEDECNREPWKLPTKALFKTPGPDTPSGKLVSSGTSVLIAANARQVLIASTRDTSVTVER